MHIAESGCYCNGPSRSSQTMPQSQSSRAALRINETMSQTNDEVELAERKSFLASLGGLIDRSIVFVILF